MDREAISARLNLHAFLPLLEEVVKRDEEAKEICKGWRASILFHIMRGPSLHLKFKDGLLYVEREGVRPASINFLFSSPSLFNRMMKGERWAIPFIIMEPWKVGMLRGFMKLTKILERYLMRAEEETLPDEEVPFAALLLLYGALWAVKVVGENDPRLEGVKKDIPDGVIEVRIGEKGPAGHIVVQGGGFAPFRGRGVKPDAIMEFREEDVARRLLAGRLDPLASIGLGQVRLMGFIPMIDSMNAILDRVPLYIT